MDDQGEIHYCLGMSIKRDREAKVLTISQKSYLENILKKFQMFDCKPVATPLEPGRRFEKLSDDEESVNKREYQAAIGSLIYASVATRPDLSTNSTSLMLGTIGLGIVPWHYATDCELSSQSS